MLKNIILVGFMGSGKTSIGRELSKTLGYPLIDTDALIVERAGKSIRRIFENEGEDRFREMESAVLADLDADDPQRRIIATGGGIVTRPVNRERLRRLGYVVWLVASPAAILERTGRNRERPLLNTVDPEGTIATLLAAREDLYRETAHLTIETDALTLAEVTAGIIESARYHFGSDESD